MTTVPLLLVLVLAGCTATPAPTATPEPTPEPTPQVITVEVEVEVTPLACLDAIDDLLAADVVVWELALGILEDYADFPDENLEDFGARVEQRLIGFGLESTPAIPSEAIAECRAAA